MNPIDTREMPQLLEERLRALKSNPRADPLLSDMYESAPGPVQATLISRLVAKVYETAPVDERSRLLEHLLRPLGVLSLVAVASGVFAKLVLHRDWPRTRIGLEEVQNVQTSDVIALVDYVQQVSVHAVDGVAGMLAASPVLAGSAAAAVLVRILLRRSRNQPESGSDFDP